MSDHTHTHTHSHEDGPGHTHDHGDASDPRYRRILWIALVVNLAMFAIEIGAGVRAGSVSLLADAIDFFGDAANCGLSIAVSDVRPIFGNLLVNNPCNHSAVLGPVT